MPYTIQDFLQSKAAHAPTFSADGKKIAFLSNLGGTFQVCVAPSDAVDLPPSEARQLTNFDDSVSLVKFSPTDPDLLLFARDSGGDEMHQLYTLDIASHEIRALTETPTAQHGYGDWSRDGAKVAYTSTKRNGTDHDAYEFDLATGEERMVASLGGYCGVVSYSPSGKYLVIDKARGSFLDTELYLVDVTGNAQPRLLTPHEDKALYAQAEWLADESGFYTVSDDEDNVSGIRFVSLTNGVAKALPPEWPVESIALSPDQNCLAVVSNAAGISVIAIYRISAEHPECLLSDGFGQQIEDGIIAGLEWDWQSARLAFAQTNYAESFNVLVSFVPDQRLARITPLTEMPFSVPCEEMPKPELIHYTSFDGLSVPAFLYLPTNTPAEAKIPAVVYIHGGPEGQFRPSYNPVIQYFAHQGYAVIAPNVRGSDGYGKAYLALDDRHKRLDSVRDLEWLYRWIEQDGRIDPKRVALMGGSYGGYMVLAGLAFQPNLWAAGVDIVGIANLVTFLENTSPYRRAVREAEYGSLATDREFLASASPINKADQIRAPLFIIHGANDPRVPLSEAEQMRDTLATRGVHAELLVYSDEGHGLAKLKNRLDAYPKVAKFLAGIFGKGSDGADAGAAFVS